MEAYYNLRQKSNLYYIYANVVIIAVLITGVLCLMQTARAEEKPLQLVFFFSEDCINCEYVENRMLPKERNY